MCQCQVSEDDSVLSEDFIQSARNEIDPRETRLQAQLAIMEARIAKMDSVLRSLKSMWSVLTIINIVLFMFFVVFIFVVRV